METISDSRITAEFLGEREDWEAVAFVRCDFAGANLRRLNFRGAAFDHCQFNDESSEQPADLNWADLRETVFTHCNLSMVEACHCKAYEITLEDCQMQGADFSQADFLLPVGGTEMASASIQTCNLSWADFSHTNLNEVTLSGCRMTETLLHGTNLQRAHLQNNEMHNLAAEGLSLQGADLRGSVFNNLDPRLIDLSDVIMTPEQMVYLAHCLDIQLADLD